MNETRSETAEGRDEAVAGRARRSYKSPILVVYGKIREITQQNGPNIQKDGGNNAVGNRT